MRQPDSSTSVTSPASSSTARVQLPTGYSLRAPTMDDIAAAVVVMNRATLAAAGVSDATEGLVKRHWSDPDRDLSTDNLLAIASDGSIVGVAELHPFPPYTEHEFDLFIDPDHAGLGLDRVMRQVLVDRSLDLSRQHHAGLTERPFMLTTAYTGDTTTHAALLAEGYRPIRMWQRMEINLIDTQLPTPVWPGGLAVRSFDPTREGETYELWEAMEAAFADHWSHVPIAFERWQHHAIDHEPNFDPSLFFLVVDASQPERILGAAMCRLERPGDPTAGHVRELGIRREARGRGAALALLLHLFAEFQRRGKERVSLGVDSESLTGANRLYVRAGMQPVLELLYYRRDLDLDLDLDLNADQTQP